MEEELILKYLQHDCNEEELQQINQWLSESEKNRQELFSLELAYNSGKLRKLQKPDFLIAQREKLEQKIAQQEIKEKQRSRRFSFTRYAASIVVIIATAISGYMIFTKDRTPLITMETGDEVKNLTLPDGSKVWLNQHSTIIYPEQFNKKNKRVRLKGEGYFEVKKNPEHPLIVESDNLCVGVYGTTFNMKCPSNSSLSSVSLIEGEVEVKSLDKKSAVLLQPGQKAELDKATGKLYVIKKNTQLDAVWHNNMIPFRHTSIKKIFATLEEVYDVSFDLSEEIIRSSYTYTGSVKKYPEIEQTLEALCNSVPVEYEVKEGKVYVSVR